MKAQGEKIVATFLVMVAAGFMALWSVLRGWALYPPKLDVASAVLAPLGHVGMRIVWA